MPGLVRPRTSKQFPRATGPGCSGKGFWTLKREGQIGEKNPAGTAAWGLPAAADREPGTSQERVVFDVHCDDEPAGDAGVLQCEVSQSAGAEDRNRLGGSPR